MRAIDDPPAAQLIAALAAYRAALGRVCAAQGQSSADVERVLATSDRHHIGRPEWREAALTRQAAIYLVHVERGVPMRMIAQVAGLSLSTVCDAVRAIEDQRSDAAYDAALEAVAAAMRVAS